jgi:hypothetical protein
VSGPLFDPRPGTNERITSLWALVRELGEEAGEEEVAALLSEPTNASCLVCGRLYLKRFEVLNGRCDRCRERLVWKIEAEHPDEIQCELETGWCMGGWHGEGRTATGRCPRWEARRLAAKAAAALAAV